MNVTLSDIEGTKVILRGREVGEVKDLVLATRTGRIIALAVKPLRKVDSLEFLPRDQRGNVLVPASVAVLREGTIVISEGKLKVLLARRNSGRSETGGGSCRWR
ncbi:MAG: PRC-barrel domain-containing protein [Candidatus Baldrarchaeia archaeon]